MMKKLLLAAYVMIISLVNMVSIHAQEISPYLFGQNHWLADRDEGRTGYLHLLWDKVEASGVKTIRIGGNGYEHHFPSREKLNQMIDTIRSIGAEPLLQVPRSFSALQAKELVEYYTKSESRKVNLWSIGNEPMLHDRNTLEEVHEFILRIAYAMKEVAPEIRIFVFDGANLKVPAYAALCGGELDITGLKQNGSWLIDGISFHNYPNGREFDRDDIVFTGPDKIRKEIEILTQLIQQANAKHGRAGEEALLWGLTEFNVTYVNPNREISGYGNPSFLGGQFIAEIFGYGMEYGACVMNPWCINETDVVRTDFGYLGFPREFYPRSSYYHMQMMSDYLTGKYIHSTDNQGYVKTVAATSQNGISLLIMNQHAEEDFDFEISLNGQGNHSDMSLKIAVDAGIEKTYSGSIPNQTSRILVFNKAGELQREVNYSLGHNLKNPPPEVK